MARGTLRIERFTGQAQLGTAVPGASSAIAGEAQQLDGLARRLGAQADRAAAREGELAGTRDALAGKPNLRRSGSTYGDAYDQAALRTYADQLDASMYRQADELALQHQNDPAALKAGLGDLRQQMLSGDVLPDPVARAAFERSFSRVELGLVRAAERDAQTRQRQVSAAAATDALTAGRANLERQGYALGLDKDGLEATEQEVKKVGEIAERAEASGAITPGATQRVKAELERDRATAHLKGAFDRAPPAERKTFIDQLTTDYKTGTGLAGKLDLDGYERLLGSFERQLSADNVATTRVENTLKTQATAIQKLASEGYGIAPDQWKAIDTAAAAVPGGNETVAALRSEAEWFHTLAARPAVEAETSITAMKAKTSETGATTLSAARNQRADTFLRTMSTQLKEDPLGWADRAGVASVPAIDFADPSSLAARADAAEAVASHYGTPAVYLRPQEKASLARNIEQGGEAMLAAVNGITNGFGSRAPAVLREVSTSAPVLAHVGGVMLAGGSPELASDVAEAVAMRRDTAFKPPTWKPQPFRDMANNVLGEAFTASPEALRSAETTAKTAFEARAFRRGLAPDLGDADSKAVFERTLQEAAGATFDRNGIQYGGVGTHGGGWLRDGTKVVVPTDVRADRFSDVIGAVRDEDLGGVISARELQGARLLAVGPGRYRVALGDPASDDPQYVTTPDGRFWTLDLNALEPALRARVPGAYR
ncbi:Uncharacterised protein [Starkeya nomas]|uniref:Uncharacterized protein n=1 Tax=Starkeya nomas TaxID=2666134 RepID=A0A5S9NZI8_9HYPH|nr:hypothetical protein [Starkeya nomas]CAA0096269.1 Uncharacterised protein [Starkeya nomas]